MSTVTTWSIAVADREDAVLTLEAPTISAGMPNIIVGVCTGFAESGDAHWIGDAPVPGEGKLDRTIPAADLRVKPVCYIEARYLVQLPVGGDCDISFKGTLTMGAKNETLETGLKIEHGAASGGYRALTWWIEEKP